MNFITQRRLTDDESAELQALNDAVTKAIAARCDWLDTKMDEVSSLHVGDDIYDLKSGRKLGKVVALYRYWSGRNDLLDNGVSCDYNYETAPNCYDNTSRQPGLSYGTRKDAAWYAEQRAAKLRGS